MGSRIKSIFLGRPSTNSNHGLQAAKPYDALVALEPPVKGSYPVAGNGPNVLQEIQRTRAKRQSTTAKGFAAPPPNVPRQRADVLQRPSTAPHDGASGGGHTRSKSAKSTRGRTLSGFSMKSPPSFFSSSRRSSMRSDVDRPPLPPNPNPPVPQIYSPPPREIKTYIPTNGHTALRASPALIPPFAQHNRDSSRVSHKSYVDILDAHSIIKTTQQTSLRRANASGVRDYGEDVADRNIADFGDRSDRDPKLDINSPELSYLKSVYAPKKTAGRAEPHSRVGSALGHVLGPDGGNRDDTQSSRGQVHPRTNSTRSTTSARSGPRPTSVYPPRVDSAAAAAVSYGNGRSHGDHRSTPSSRAADRAGRAMSPLSSAATSISEELPGQDHQSRQPVTSARAVSSPAPERGRTGAITVTTTTTTATTPAYRNNPPPVAAPARITSPPHVRHISGARAGEPTSSKTKRRSLSTTSQKGSPPPTSGRSSSRKGSMGYSVFPGSADYSQSTSRPPTSNANKRRGMIVEGASQTSGLDGIVDLKNSVDTDVTTKTLPAVVHENIAPNRHKNRQEVISRESHRYDADHRIFSVPKTDILEEIPESLAPKHRVTSKFNSNWQNVKFDPSGFADGPDGCEAASRSSTDSAPDGPVIGLARGEPPPRTRSRGNSKASSLNSNKNRESILSSKKEHVTIDGIPKTEYVWRHPPVFETAMVQAQPVYIGAGIGDLSGENYYSDEYDETGGEFAATGSTSKGEEGLLFRDSGYGSGGMLPGLKEIFPVVSRGGSA